MQEEIVSLKDQIKVLRETIRILSEDYNSIEDERISLKKHTDEHGESRFIKEEKKINNELHTLQSKN